MKRLLLFAVVCLLVFLASAGVTHAAGVDKPISGLAAKTGQPGTNDLLVIVDRADFTQSTNGSTKSMTWSNFWWAGTQYPAQTLVLTNGAKIVPGGGGRLTVYDTNGNAQINLAPYSYTEVKYTDATSGDSLGVRINTNGFNISGTVGATTYSGGFSNNQWYGDGSTLTGIYHKAGQCPTNIFLASLSTTAAGTLTNNGGFSSGTYVCQILCSPAPSANARLAIEALCYVTNGNTTAGDLYAYVGPNTNYVGRQASLLSSTKDGRGALASQQALFHNWGSFTNQIAGNAFASTPTANGITNLVDTSVPFYVYVCAATTTSFTNGIITQVRAYWVD